MLKKHSTRRHPMMQELDDLFSARGLLEAMPLDHPSRGKMEEVVRDMEAKRNKRLLDAGIEVQYN